LIAFDTNILVYAQQDDTSDSRHERALGIIYAATLIDGCMPVQVLGEFLNVCVRKLKMTPDDVIDQIDEYADVFDCPQTGHSDLVRAAHLADLHDLQFFDALIVTVSSKAGATILLSEDMHDGLEIDGLRIVNPFVAANDALLADYFGSALEG
jgi:predicted nucleic acid-binding protein